MRKDGGPAFPMSVAVGPTDDMYCSADVSGGVGMSLRDYFAAHAPLPEPGEIEAQFKYDQARNPHNEPYHNKPKRRSRAEIIADLAYAHADALLKARGVEMSGRILVCGGRDYADRDRLYGVLDDLLKASGYFDCVISGMARGADRLAAEWADARKVPLAPFPADWNKHGRAAGPIRNQQMLDDGKPTLVIAFPGGRGTADMVRRSKAADVRVMELQS